MPPATPAAARKLIVLGDSGVYGWGDPQEGGWCERLRRHWMELPDGPVLYPLGVRGDGLERVAARLQAEVACRGELRRQRPQGILLAVGLNDSARVGRRDGRPQLDADGFLFGLQQLLQRAQAIAPVLVLGLTPVWEEAMPFAEVLWYQLEAVRRYEALLEQACMEANLPFLPLLESLLAIPTGPAGSAVTACTSTATATVRCMGGFATGQPCCSGPTSSPCRPPQRCGEPWPSEQQHQQAHHQGGDQHGRQGRRAPTGSCRWPGPGGGW
jgi:lysophospholipase L1-like esterase